MRAELAPLRSPSGFRSRAQLRASAAVRVSNATWHVCADYINRIQPIG